MRSPLREGAASPTWEAALQVLPGRQLSRSTSHEVPFPETPIEGSFCTLPDGVSPLQADDPAAVGPYRTLGRLGSGGMGTVYLAVADSGHGGDRASAGAVAGTDPAGSGSGRLVAAKVVHRQLAHDEHFRARFRTEARLAARVASFSTAPVLDFGEADGCPYLITEYIEGVPLDRMVRRKGALSESAVHGVAISIAAALTSIHSAGLVHRDLKPGNVVLSLSGARVIDFGIARALDTPSSLTRSGVTMGSPGWMAPEQILGKRLTSAADVFAWGCLVGYAATARHPFGGGDAVAVAYRTLHDEPNLDGVPDSLRPMVRRALAAAPEQRPTAYGLLTRLSGSTARRPASPLPEPGDPTPAQDLLTPERASAATRAVAHAVAGSGVTAAPADTRVATRSSPTAPPARPARRRGTRRDPGARRGKGSRRRWFTLLGCAVLLSLTAVLALGVTYPDGVSGDRPGAPRTPVDDPERNSGRSDPLDPDPADDKKWPTGRPDTTASPAPSAIGDDKPAAPTSAAPSRTPSEPNTPSASPSHSEPPAPTPTEPADANE